MQDLVIREIESQLSIDTDTLLRMLGSAQTMGAKPATSRDGKVILENAKRTLRERICNDNQIQEIYEAASSTKIQLVAAVIDVIAGAISGVSPITVSVLIVKEGLDSLCKDIWSND